MARARLGRGVVVFGTIAAASVAVLLVVDATSVASPPQGTCPPAATRSVGFCAGDEDCPASGGACACKEGSTSCCAPGFCYSRAGAGCQQERCPPGVGRRDDATCACDPPKQAIYDACRQGLMVSCGTAIDASIATPPSTPSGR
jgi:hypothetical protein